MFEENKYNSNSMEFWLRVTDTKSTIVLTFLPDNRLVDFRVFNQKSIYKCFEIFNDVFFYSSQFFNISSIYNCV